MNLVQGAMFLAVAGGAVYFFAKPAPADEFPLAMTDVYQKLADVRVAYNPNGADQAAFAGHSVTPSGNGEDQVTWRVGHSDPVDCVISLSALKPTLTKVAVSCNAPPSELTEARAGTPLGTLDGPKILAIRNDVIEKIDSTLNNQPFDTNKTGALAWRWPADVVHHDNLIQAIPKMQGAAIKASLEVAKEQAAAEAAHTDTYVPQTPQDRPAENIDGNNPNPTGN